VDEADRGADDLDQHRDQADRRRRLCLRRISFADTTETCTNAVQAEVAYHSSSTTANVAKTSMMESGTERVVYSGAMNPNSTLTYRSAVISPASGTWSQTKVNGLSARICFGSTIGAHPFWDALMVEYNVDL
jgi:hypothetical protein